MNDEAYMQQALELAKRGMGHVNPNPLVGAVIVKKGQVIGTGFHAKYGQAHAERNALAAATHDPKGATLYVTLEPCCHQGKTPPCTEAIIQSGIQRVVIGCLDPNPLMASKGVQALKVAGVSVTVGVLKCQCKALNAPFFHYIQHKTPYVVMKYAMTMDGKIATVTGASKWITGETARQHVHQTRNRYAAIMVGVGTILADNPALTCRLSGGGNPVRIVCDSHLHTPLDSHVVTTAQAIKTIIATTNTDVVRQEAYRQKGVELVVTTAQNGRVNLPELMVHLGNRGIDSILLEGGGTLHFTALETEIVHKLQCYIAPKLFGGATATSPVMGAGFKAVENKIRLHNTTITQFDEDFLLESEVSYVHRHC